MRTIPQEILEKFNQLDTVAQRELLALLEQQVEVEQSSLNQWLEEAIATRDQVLAIPSRLYLDNMLLKQAFALAGHFNRPTAYDAQYLAVAERLGCEMWTNNERLDNSVKHELI